MGRRALEARAPHNVDSMSLLALSDHLVYVDKE
jgi:hypothetical protein